MDAASTNNDSEGLITSARGCWLWSRAAEMPNASPTPRRSVNRHRAIRAIDVDVATSAPGISYDPRDGSFVSVEQDTPQKVLAGTLNFATGPTMAPLFDPMPCWASPAVERADSAVVDALVGTRGRQPAILSMDSRRLVEVTALARSSAA